MTNCSETFSDLASQLSELAKSPSSDAEKNAAATAIGQKILAAARGPGPDWQVRMMSNVELTAIKILLDWDAMGIIPTQGTISYTELARRLNADPSLVRRICWTLVASGFLRQHGQDQVTHTELSQQYLPGKPDGVLLQMIFEEHMLPALKMPEYFEQYGRREPATRLHTPWAFSHGWPDKEVWEIHEENPKRMQRFMKAMELSENFIPMAGIYDFNWVKSKLDDDKDRTILVDVGGGKGHVIKAILKENPFLPTDRIILQDRDEVIDVAAALKEPELQGVQLQKHDFHKPQPVKHALLYWMRRCLHDYGDDVCAKMLSQLSDAMAPDSKVLISEHVLPNPPTPLGAMTDFGMMEIGGKERTTQDWEELVARAGLKIEKIYGLGKSIQVLECAKA